MEMIEFVFAQYSVSMGICLNLNFSGTPAIDLLAVNLPFPYQFLCIRFSSSKLVTHTMECLCS